MWRGATRLDGCGRDTSRVLLERIVLRERAVIRLMTTISFCTALSASCKDPHRDGREPSNSVQPVAANARKCVDREVTGVVAYDPEFHTLVHPPHGGVYVAPKAGIGDTVAPRAPLAEIVSGPNRWKITAPVGGVVVHAGAASGSFLRETDAPFVIADPERLVVRVDDAPPGFGDAPALTVKIDGIDEPFVSSGRVEGYAVIVSMPRGLMARQGAKARLSVNCS